MTIRHHQVVGCSFFLFSVGLHKELTDDVNTARRPTSATFVSKIWRFGAAPSGPNFIPRIFHNELTSSYWMTACIPVQSSANESLSLFKTFSSSFTSFFFKHFSSHKSFAWLTSQHASNANQCRHTSQWVLHQETGELNVGVNTHFLFFFK